MYWKVITPEHSHKKNKKQMASIFITGSADGLGKLAAKELVKQGHRVVLHARNQDRAKDALSSIPGAAEVLIADLSDVEATKRLAAEANALGTFDAVIHNAGVYQTSGRVIFAVNTLAPYLLTCLMHRPGRLIYLGSDMHLSGDPELKRAVFENGSVSYSDSKLQVLLLTMAVARKWPDVYANAVDPGWVPTKMGGAGAPDDLEKGFQTQVWLAASQEDQVKVSGRYFFHKKAARYLPAAGDVLLQEQFLEWCEQVTGVHFPEAIGP